MVLKEIEKAGHIYQKYGGALIEDPVTSLLLKQYKEAIQNSHLIMEEAGVVKACSACAEVNTSGCCFSGVEEWYDAYLLLINILLGVDLPARTDFTESCFFVGERGCRLMARHSFCVNYLCPDLSKDLDRAQGKLLIKTVGLEILAGYDLEKTIRAWIGIRERWSSD